MSATLLAVVYTKQCGFGLHDRICSLNRIRVLIIIVNEGNVAFIDKNISREDSLFLLHQSAHRPMEPVSNKFRLRKRAYTSYLYPADLFHDISDESTAIKMLNVAGLTPNNLLSQGLRSRAAVKSRHSVESPPA